MLKKGVRPRFRVTRNLPDDGHGFRQVLPFKRSWPAIGILAAFDCLFLLPAVSAFQDAASHWGRLEDLFDLVSALFMSGWLLGWSIAPLLMIAILLLMLFGREVIKAQPGKVEIYIGLPQGGLAAEYATAKMRNLRCEQPTKQSGKFWRGSHLVFDYGAASVAVGSDINANACASLIARLQTAAGQKIRRGEATEEELSAEQEPSSLTPKTSASSSVYEGYQTPSQPVRLSSPSTLALIAANLVPVAGAIFLGWNLADVLVLYWAESAVIGIFNVCKIIVIGKWAALLAAPFFLGHFGGFMAVHFLFLYTLFIEGAQHAASGNLAQVTQLFIDLWPALTALFLSHAYSFFVNFIGRGEYRGRTVRKQMSEPYSRIIFMHLVLIFGGGLTLVLGQPTPVLLVVIGVKIWMDVKAHLKQHSDQRKDLVE